MKKLLLLLGLSLISSSVFATRYDNGGAIVCGDFEESEQIYLEEQRKNDFYMSTPLIYGLCLLAKGEVTGDRGLIHKGIEILYDLAIHAPENNLVANYLLGEYNYNKFSAFISDEHLDNAVMFYSRVIAMTQLYPHYPPLKYSKWEERHNIEMMAYYKLPRAYLEMAFYGIVGDFYTRQLSSPNYEGDRDIPTYPKYRDKIKSSIDLVIENARVCKDLPIKPHFEEDSELFIEVCAMYYEKAIELKALQEERQEVLRKSRCKDLGSDELIESNCPEINVLDEKFVSLFKEIGEENTRILDPIRDQLVATF